MIIYPVSIIHCYLYNQSCNSMYIYIFIFIYSIQRTAITQERYTDYPDGTDDRDITDGKQSFAKTVTQSELSVCVCSLTEASVLLMVHVFSKNEDTQPYKIAAHFPGVFRSALVLQIEAKYFTFFFF